MSMAPDSPASTGPPPVAAMTTPAQQLHAEYGPVAHPVWQRAAGRVEDSGDGPKFEPLSALALELESFRRNATGSSVLLSEGGDHVPQKRARHQKNHPPPNSGALSHGDESHKTNSGNFVEPMVAQAAFGCDLSCISDDEDSVSVASVAHSQMKREAYKAAFPVKGIDCVGCTLTQQITPVVNFVKTYIDSMSEEALWKQAAFTYIREVQLPRKREDVPTPDWGWKDVRTHFLLHASDHSIARASTCRQLQTMRYVVEQKLMRVDGAEKELDKSNCELMLKIINAESKERLLLQNSIQLGKKGHGSTVGDK